MSLGGGAPIVDHGEARARALAAFHGLRTGSSTRSRGPDDGPGRLAARAARQPLAKRYASMRRVYSFRGNDWEEGDCGRTDGPEPQPAPDSQAPPPGQRPSSRRRNRSPSQKTGTRIGSWVIGVIVIVIGVVFLAGTSVGSAGLGLRQLVGAFHPHPAFGSFDRGLEVVFGRRKPVERRCCAGAHDRAGPLGGDRHLLVGVELGEGMAGVVGDSGGRAVAGLEKELAC